MRRVDFMADYLQGGATDIIARLIPLWVAEGRDHRSIIEDRADARSNAAAVTGVQSAFPPTRFALSPAPSPVVDFLRSWLHQRPAGKGI